MLRSIFALSLLGLVACAAETSPTTDSTGTQPGAASGSAETSGSGTGTGQVYSISCHGEISVKCIGGPPGTNCGGGETERPADCGAQDVKFHYAPPALRCVGTDVYEFDGSACVVHNTQGEGGQLKCQGKDCEKLFKSKDACESHRAACLAN